MCRPRPRRGQSVAGLRVEQLGRPVLALDRYLDPADPREIGPGPATAAGQGVAFDPQSHTASVGDAGQSAPCAATTSCRSKGPTEATTNPANQSTWTLRLPAPEARGQAADGADPTWMAMPVKVAPGPMWLATWHVMSGGCDRESNSLRGPLRFEFPGPGEGAKGAPVGGVAARPAFGRPLTPSPSHPRTGALRGPRGVWSWSGRRCCTSVGDHRHPHRVHLEVDEGGDVHEK